MKVSKVQEIFNAMNGEDEVWLTYISKDDVVEAFEGLEIEDETTGELLDTGNLVTNEVVKQVTQRLDDDDYLWERFNETFTDVSREVLEELVSEKKEAEADTDLWDTEGEASASKESIGSTK